MRSLESSLIMQQGKIKKEIHEEKEMEGASSEGTSSEKGKAVWGYADPLSYLARNEKVSEKQEYVMNEKSKI